MASSLTKSVYSICFFGAMLVCGFTDADLPPKVPKCRAGDVACIPNAIHFILNKYPKGNPEFGLQALDEVQLKNVVISEATESSPIQLNLKFSTFNLYGFEKANISRVVGFEKNPKNSKFEVYGILPNLLIKGAYQISGKVLLLPLNGEGDAEINLKNMKFAFKVKVTEVMREGKRYVALTKIRSLLEPEELHMNFENLFSGNKELSDSLNRTINENWKGFWTELEGGINGAVSDIVKKLVMNILQVLPYDDFYRQD